MFLRFKKAPHALGEPKRLHRSIPPRGLRSKDLVALFAVALHAALLLPTVAYAQEGAAAPEARAVHPLIEEAERIVGKVASIRGLDRLKPVKKGVKDREALRETVAVKMKAEIKPEEIEGEARTLVALGLIAPDLDLYATVLGVLTEQIAGYYDTETGELYVIEGIPLAMQKPAMAHELFHAIQDQHFTISSVQAPKTGLAGYETNTDRSLARSALIEGDATVLMIDYTFYELGQLQYGSNLSFIDNPLMAAGVKGMMASGQSLGAGESPALDEAPVIFQELLKFPYFAGLAFVIDVRAGNTWKGVDAVYNDPPDSTEQILHPERYLQRDHPTLVTFDIDATRDALGGGPWAMAYETVWGELRYRVWFDQGLERDDGGDGLNPIAASAAAGWDGDRFFTFTRGDDTVVVALTVWDSVEDAVEAQAAMGLLGAGISDGETSAQRNAHGRYVCTRGPAREGRRAFAFAEQWGAWTLYISGDTSQPVDLGAVRQAVFETRAVGDYPKTKTKGPRWPDPIDPGNDTSTPQ